MDSATSTAPAPVPDPVAPPPAGAAAQVFAGCGLGLLLGIIAGLSVSPVVQTILGALVAIVTGFLGWQTAAPKPAADGVPSPAARNLQEWRIGSFGLACVAGILLGLYVRTSEPFTSIAARVHKWTDAGYSGAEAREYVAFQHLGIQPKDKTVVAGDMQKAQRVNLFANEQKSSVCAQVNQDLDAAGRLNVFEQQHRDALTRLAREIRQAPAASQEGLAKAAAGAICEMEEGAK
jgi:hypothetical protein